MRTPGADSCLDGAADELLGIIRCLHWKQLWRNLPVLYLHSCSSHIEKHAGEEAGLFRGRAPMHATQWMRLFGLLRHVHHCLRSTEKLTRPALRLPDTGLAPST